jgi:hypothetical protein
MTQKKPTLEYARPDPLPSQDAALAELSRLVRALVGVFLLACLLKFLSG